MINLLHVYGRETMIDIELPTTSERDWHFTLEKDVFSLTSDIDIYMTVLDNRWCFASPVGYEVLCAGKPHIERYLNEGVPIHISVPESNISIVVIPAELATQISVYTKYVLDPKVMRVTFGSTPEQTICLQGAPLVASLHFEMKYVNSGVNRIWTLCPHAPCYINGALAKESALSWGDVIDVYGTRIVFLGEILALGPANYPTLRAHVSLTAANRETIKWISNLAVKAQGESKPADYRPAPRELAEYDKDPIEIEGPPEQHVVKERSMLSTIGPSFSMVIPMALGAAITGTGGVIPGLITMGGSAVAMAFWSWKNIRDQKKETQKEEARRVEKYGQYLTRKHEELSDRSRSNVLEIQRLYLPSQARMEQGATDGSLWDRNPLQDDYGFVRLGTGQCDSFFEIKIPKERFSMTEDELSDEPEKLRDQFAVMEGIPVGFDMLEQRIVGVDGGSDKRGCYPIIRAVVAQIATNYSYSDVKLVLLCDKQKLADRELLDCVRWLPHVWTDDNTMRFVGVDRESRKEVLNALMPMLQERWEEAKSSSKNQIATEYVVISTDAAFLDGSMASVYLLDPSINICTCTLIMAEGLRQLPNSCQFIISDTSQFKGFHKITDTREHWTDVHFDAVSSQELALFSRKVAPIRVQTPDTQQEVPEIISFLGLYDVETVEELRILDRWRSHRSFEDISAPVGISAGDVICCLDIHERAHGPHGLVAGTTGSGKSETLMTWILSLAVNYSPEDVCFLLIDYKGGGLVNQFEGSRYRLPHLAGTITNLAGNQIQRALVSINSENIRRQRMLSEAGANDIYDYAKMYRNGEVTTPLPHLIIAVDEFAELKKQSSGFMDELVSVAAIGRSLGVHLVLATQRPEGVVDEKISSNSRFRLCLKVQTPQDSKSMLERSDAAYITQKGRGFLRVGNDELFQMFQSAWSRAPYPADATNTRGELAKLLSMTGRAEIVGTHHLTKRKEQARIAWAEYLASLASHVLEQNGISSNECEKDPAIAAKMVDLLYSGCSADGYSVSRSELNDSRFANLIHAYGLLSSQETETQSIGLGLLRIVQSLGLHLPEESQNTQIDAIVQELDRVARENDLVLRDALWLPELPGRLVPDSLGTHLPPGYWQSYKRGQSLWSLETCIGLYDDPEHQYQAPQLVDFTATGGYIVIGASQTGKSTLFQSMAYSLIRRYTPNDLWIYALDYSSHKLECLQNAPQVGGVVFEDDNEAPAKLFFLIDSLLAERKHLLRGGSFTQYKSDDEKENNLPAVLVFIDNYGQFSERTEGKYDADVLRYAKEGVGCGIYLVISGANVSTGEVPSKLADVVKGRICLELNDSYEYKNLLGVGRCVVYPDAGIPGRGLVGHDGVGMEFQVVLPCDASDDFRMSREIQLECERIQISWKGRPARAVPRIPEKQSSVEFFDTPEVQDLLKDESTLPIGYDYTSAQPTGIELSKMLFFLVCGKPMSGRKTFLPLLIESASKKGGKLYVFGAGSGLVRITSERCKAEFFASGEDLYPFFEEFGEELKRRNVKKRNFEKSGFVDDELFACMQEEERIYLFIEDLTSFVQSLYNPPEGVRSVANFFEVLAEKSWYHQLFIFVGMDPSSMPTEVKMTAFVKSATKDGTGIHFGGNVPGNQFLKFGYLSFSEQNKTQPQNVGLIASSDTYPDGGSVVIPFVAGGGD